MSLRLACSLLCRGAMIHRSFLFNLIVISACTGDPGSDPDLLGSADPIIGGRRDRGHSAVGQIGHRSEDGMAWVCTGTLIDPTTVLTAAHCLYGLDGDRLPASALVFEAKTEQHEIASIATDRYTPDARGAWNDIALLGLWEASSVRPIPIATEAPIEGTAAKVVGFGVTRATGPHTGLGAGTKRVGDIVLDQVDPKEILYLSEPTGACYGDSGGPLLQRIAERNVIVGVTSRGTRADCTGVDIATRVDAYSTWIERVVTMMR